MPSKQKPARKPIARYKARPARRNPEGSVLVTSEARLPSAMKKEVAKLQRKYTEWHWGAKPKKLIHVQDRLVPNLVGIGKLIELHVAGRTIKLPKGAWIGFDPKHPHERLHIVLPAAFREKLRKSMKYMNLTQPIQEIAEATKGTQAKYKLPNIHGVPVGVLDAVVYFTDKEGDGPSLYQHEFGHEHSNGIKPILAIDVSGRCWATGGSYLCPLAGVTG